MSTHEDNILNHLPEQTPPDSVWERIETELDRDDRRRILPVWLRYAGIAAACLILALLGYLNLGDKQGVKTHGTHLVVRQKTDSGKQGQALKSADAIRKKDLVWMDLSDDKVMGSDPNTAWGFSRFSKPFTVDDISDSITGYINVALNSVSVSDVKPGRYKVIHGGSWKDIGYWGFAGEGSGSSGNAEGYRRNYLQSDNIGYKDLSFEPGIYPGEFTIVEGNKLAFSTNNPHTIYYNADSIPYDIRSAIVVTGEVDTRRIGTYTLTYYVQDVAGNAVDSDGDHVPDHRDREMTVETLLAGKRFTEANLRYQCVIKDTVNLADFEKFLRDKADHEKRDKEPVSNTESYASLIENEYKNPFIDPFSTFSIDVDNASYTNTRRMLAAGELPPKDAVRIEEFVNYFSYKYPQPVDRQPFSINMETASCPWNKDTRLVQIGIQGMDVNREQLPASNLVFLVDVSGSMSDENKLPLVKRSLKLLVEQMRPQDKIALVAYAGAAGLVLPSTACSEKETIKAAIDNLDAGGSTAGGAGLELAYKTAAENYMTSGNNRIILVTDGDFNVGLQSDEDMKTLIESKRQQGVFLTVCGFGMGNLKDSKMETLADHGNGSYYYIDNFRESRKVFASGLTGTLLTIAKDVKLQVEFNPALVKAYRLIGYENRVMAAQDFADDTRDAGELGAGHTVTALYEIIPAGSQAVIPGFTELKYQKVDGKLKEFGQELLTLHMRYKNPGEDSSRLLEQVLQTNANGFEQASDNFRFACGVTMYGMLLRDSKFKGISSYELAKQLIAGCSLNEKDGYRDELLALIEKARLLSVPQ